MSDIKALGATLVAVSPQTPQNSRKMATQNKLGFDVLSDSDNALARKLGLVFELPEDLKKVYMGFDVDLSAYNGDDSWTLPMPARFIIDEIGTIRFAEAHPDYTTRPEPTDTLEKLRALS